MDFIHVHSSGRYDRSTELLIEDIRNFHTFASIVTHTEMAADSRERAWRNKWPEWSYYRSKMEGGDDECVIEWKDADWELIGVPRGIQMTSQTFHRPTGNESAPVHVVQVRLRSKHDPEQQIFVEAAHMPTQSTSLRVSIWNDLIKNWAAHIKKQRTKYPGVKYLIVADWNVDYRRLSGRARMARYFLPLRLKAAWWRNAPRIGGTHGNNLIDGAYTDLKVLDCRLLPDTPSSDHRPFAVKLRLPSAKSRKKR